MHDLPAIYLLTRGWATFSGVLLFALCLKCWLDRETSPSPLTLLD